MSAVNLITLSDAAKVAALRPGACFGGTSLFERCSRGSCQDVRTRAVFVGLDSTEDGLKDSAN